MTTKQQRDTMLVACSVKRFTRIPIDAFLINKYRLDIESEDLRDLRKPEGPGL